jgi:hypothetical protein
MPFDLPMKSRRPIPPALYFNGSGGLIIPGNKNLPFLSYSPIFALSFRNNTKTSQK